MSKSARPKTFVIRAAKFPNDQAAKLDQACSRLGVSKSELIITGALAEAERRIALLNQSGAGQVAASAF